MWDIKDRVLDNWSSVQPAKETLSRLNHAFSKISISLFFNQKSIPSILPPSLSMIHNYGKRNKCLKFKNKFEIKLFKSCWV